MDKNAPQNDTLYQSYSKGLYKITGQESMDNISAMINADPGANNSTMVNISASSIGSGTATGMTSFSSGGIESGKESWADGTAGFFLGIDVDGVAKMNIGNVSAYMKWDGANLTVVGGVSVGSLNIPDTTTASSFHTDSSGNSWWGTNVATGYATAPASILATGVARFTNMTITGGSVTASTLAGIVGLANTNVAAQNWTQTSVFSASSATVVAWGAGTFTTAGGTAYSIGASNTGTMAARTYIYLDIAVSTTAYQVTTTAALAVGTGKVLVATALNGTTQASFQVFGSNGGMNINGADIATGTITGAEIAATTIAAANIVAGTITGTQIANTTIAAGNIISATITATQIAAATITGTQIAATTIAAGNIVSNTITAGQIAAATITTTEIAASTIVGNNIAANTITSGKISVSQLSAISADLGAITAGSITINGGVASIDSSGNSTFKSIQVGGSTRQYTISDSGIFSYGDGSDGDVTISSNTTLTGDKYYRNLVVNSGAVLNCGNYRIFCSVSLTLSGNASIVRNGNNGGSGGYNNGGDAVGGGYLGRSGYGGGANHATTTYPQPGESITLALGGIGAGGQTGTTTPPNVKLIANWHLATLLDITSTGATLKMNAASGGGQGENGVTFQGAGGGSGGGIVAIYAKLITINSGSVISSNGGKGGDAAGSADVDASGGYGGGGGVVILVYNTIVNNGSITANGGLGGAKKGTGNDGGVGGTGVIYQFQLSL